MIIQPLSWFNKTVVSQIGSGLYKNTEIPLNTHYYSPVMAENFIRWYERVVIPSQTNLILHKQKGLLSREVEFIAKRLDNYLVNVFEVAETMGDSSLPMIYELLQDKRLNRYVPVTPSLMVNETAINRLKLFCLNSRSDIFKSEQVQADIEIRDFKAEYRDIVKNDNHDETINLFLIVNSRLGNCMNPKQVLQNFYNTMAEGDYLAILQGIYKSGSEDILVADYRQAYITPDIWTFSPELINLLDPGNRLKVFWSDEEGFNGVKMSVEIEDKIELAGVDLKSKEEVTVFRSARFKEFELRKIFKDVGFKLVDIAYDDDIDNALFFLQK